MIRFMKLNNGLLEDKISVLSVIYCTVCVKAAVRYHLTHLWDCTQEAWE